MDVAAYLRRIEYAGPLAPSPDTLRALHYAHLLTVPFENLDISRRVPILLDEERRRIGKPPRLPFKMLRGEEEKLLFDMAARSATRRLVLMASRLDEASDRERIASEFFLRAASAACGKPVSLRELAEGKISLSEKS